MIDLSREVTHGTHCYHQFDPVYDEVVGDDYFAEKLWQVINDQTLFRVAFETDIVVGMIMTQTRDTPVCRRSSKS